MRALVAIVIFSLAAPASAMACGMRMSADTEILLVDALGAIDAPSVDVPANAEVVDAAEVEVKPAVDSVVEPVVDAVVEPATEPQATDKRVAAKKPQS